MARHTDILRAVSMSTAHKTRATLAQQTTLRLIAVARASFATVGFNATSLDPLVLQAGVT